MSSKVSVYCVQCLIVGQRQWNHFCKGSSKKGTVYAYEKDSLKQSFLPRTKWLDLLLLSKCFLFGCFTEQKQTKKKPDHIIGDGELVI